MIVASVDSPTATQTAVKLHRADIDGLRAIAVLAVLGYHCNLSWMSGGYVGVDVFFVISGYLICGLILNDNVRGRFSIARFYERRCKRILPALFTVLLFCILAALLITSPNEAREIGLSFMAVSGSVSNFLFYRQGNYFNGGGTLNPLLMTWSLAVEEQFYLVVPLLLLLLYKYSRKHMFTVLVLLSVASLAGCTFLEFRHPEFNFYLPFTRAWELGAGGLLALYESRREGSEPIAGRTAGLFSWFGLALIAISIVFYTPGVRFPGYEALPPVLGTTMVLASRNGGANRLLATRPFVAVGLISYSLYLWHWPLLSFASIANPVRLTISNRALLMAIAFIAAIGSYFFVEQPFRRQITPHTGKLLLRYAFCSACLLLLGAGLYFGRGLPVRSPDLAETESALNLDRPHSCVTMFDTQPNLNPRCVPPLSSRPAIALLGDSHAESLQPLMEDYARKHGYQLLVLAMPACPPLQHSTRFSTDAPVFGGRCARFNQWVMHFVSNRPDVKIVLLAGSWPMAPEDLFLPTDFAGDPAKTSLQQRIDGLVDGLGEEVRQLENAGKRVVIIDDHPSLPFDPLSRYRYAELPVRRLVVDILLGQRITDPLAPSIDRSIAISHAAERVRGELLALGQHDPQLAIVDTKNLFCGPASCAVFDQKKLLYIDNNHLSNLGGARVRAELERILAEKNQLLVR